MNHLFPVGYAALWGVWIAQLPASDLGQLAEKAGFAGLSVLLVWWITNRLSRQLDEQAGLLKAMSEAIARLAEAVARHDAREESKQ
jgi:membrane protein implicated in regulation of membrane protease activity